MITLATIPPWFVFFESVRDMRQRCEREFPWLDVALEFIPYRQSAHDNLKSVCLVTGTPRFVLPIRGAHG